MVKKILLILSILGISLSAEIYSSSGTVVTYGVADDCRLITHTIQKEKPKDDSFFGNITNNQIVKTFATAAGFYIAGRVGDKLLSHDTRSGEYGAVGTIVGSLIPGVGPLVGGAIGVLAGGLKNQKEIPVNPYSPYQELLK